MDGNGQQYYYYRPRPVFGFPRLTPAVKTLLIVTGACFALQIIARIITRTPDGQETIVEHLFALHPQAFIRGLFPWQIVTSLFLHGSLWHLAMNMLPLSFFGFGPGLERFTGARRFYAIYFLSGIGGNLLFLAANLQGTVPVIGASGAVCGILAAYAMAFPERFVLLFFVFPIKVKWVVLGIFAMELMLEVSRPGAGNIAHGAHVGGFVFGWAYMKLFYKLSLPFAFIERMKWRVRHLFSSLPAPRNPFRRPPGERKYPPIDDDSFIDQEVDPILDKISKQGIHSLTADERRILKRAHDRMGRG
ncbi:MAG: rhomboid family intramembrane serine protease [Verrucomicrobia bacterium]|nr:rhomboid family intramembrane serine protease [Verrucomicrobiota bacterium]